jgi:peptidoglycan hydrolase-like protein with peptidoglycan-binding domain
MSGQDVRQLESNLVALGYDPDGEVEVDGVFDEATAAAVKRWQKKLGVEQTGVVERGTVVFQPGPRRVSSTELAIGDGVSAGTAVLQLSATRQLVTLNLEATRQSLVEEGTAVEVELPDGRTVEATVAGIGRVAQTDTEPDGSQGDPYVEVAIALDASAGVELDQAPVDVNVTTQAAENALAVPVSALVALASGGYGVEVREGTGTRFVRVEPGQFADGWVELTGNALPGGTQVVVPA